MNGVDPDWTVHLHGCLFLLVWPIVSLHNLN